MNLKEFFQRYPQAALGFSGGVDSAYLLYAARQYGADIKPYFIKTAFQPQFELEDALNFVKQIGVGLTVVEYDICKLPAVAANAPDRCYHCKRAIFQLLKERALADGYSWMLDGTNASDNFADRPGMRALKELSIQSPLRDCGLSKDEIRRRSREAGLFTWNKPAYACLATRIPVNEPITPELLKRVELAEKAMLSLGFSDFRVRLFHGAARIQVLPDQLQKAASEREEILRQLHPYFQVVLLDLKTR